MMSTEQHQPIIMKSTNVLSDKVNRALHVRTDTPAMKAALSALATLPSSTSTTSDNTGSGVIDAKSVRAAIETDALRRALQFQTELQKLARDATVLRERVDTVARVAGHIGRIVDGRIISKEQADVLLHGDESGGDGGELYGRSGGVVVEDTTTSSWELERTLASKLHAAHKSYVDATHRQIAVDAFLDKFDLGDNEARLLDHYNFQGFILPGEYEYEDSSNPWCHPSAALHINPNPSGETMEDATSFLNALERLVVIRMELSKTFGNSSGGIVSGGGVEGTMDESMFDHDNIGQDNDTIGNRSSSSGQLGTNSALRMMEQLATRQERAYERLYTFIQYFLGIGSATPNSHHNVPTSSNDAGRSYSASLDASQFGALGRFLDGDDMDEAFGHPIIRRALRVLRHSPAHHVHALELMASSRRTEVTRRFLLALTSGYGGMAPLEMRAHDPVGYVGDMLAFCFRAFRVEGELVKTLFLSEKEDGGLEEKEQDEEYDDTIDSRPMSASELLAQSMGGLSRPLKTRLSQVIMSLASQGGAVTGDGSGGAIQPGDDEDTSSSLNRLVAIYSVSGLLRFYCSAIEKALEKAQAENEVITESPLLTTCDECLAEAADCYVASLRAYGAMLGSHSLSSSQTEAHLAQRAIMLIADERVASPGFADDALDTVGDDLVSKQLSLSFLVSTMVDAAMTHLKTLDGTSALKSAVNAASKSGLDAKETTKWMALIDEKEQNLVEVLVGTEADIVLEECGLGAIRSAIKDMDRVYIEGMTMSSHPGLSRKEVEAAMKKFYSSLFSPPIPTFEDVIKDAQLRKIARSRTAQIVIDLYQEVYGALSSERGGYSDLSFLEHDPNQVKALLSL
eukprot:scaffold43737_cov204-Skeletonema_marinoi.AAC.2